MKPFKKTFWIYRKTKKSAFNFYDYLKERRDVRVRIPKKVGKGYRIYYKKFHNNKWYVKPKWTRIGRY